VVLGGGGVTGGWFEMGVLRALDAAMVGHSVTDFDIFVGVSCGAVVGCHLAAGIAPHRLMGGLGKRGAEVMAPFERSHVLRPNWRELASRASLMPKRLLDTMWLHASGRNETNIPETLFALGELLPAGFLDGRGLEQFIRKNLLKSRCQDRFEMLEKELYVVAVDVDSGEPVFFGDHDHRDVPISRTVLASSSFPPAFAPCRINGRDYIDGGVDKNFHLDVAVAAGARLIICVNPLMPLYTGPGRSTVRLMDGTEGTMMDKGMPGVLDQTVRMIMHNRMAQSVEQLQKRYPDVDILMLEPEADDYEVFRYNVGRFSARIQMARHGYVTARKTLLKHFDKHHQMFARYGLTLARETLDAEYAVMERGKFRRKQLLETLGSPVAQRPA